MMGTAVQSLLVKVLFLVIVCLLGLQYLSLLQVDEKGRHYEGQLVWDAMCLMAGAEGHTVEALLDDIIESGLIDAVADTQEELEWITPLLIHAAKARVLAM